MSKTCPKQRVWKLVNKSSIHHCWNWKGSLKSSGYGQFHYGRVNGKCIVKVAHRYIYEIHHNKLVPSDIDICHKCDNRLCCNPDHLFEGTRQDNMQDCIKKNRFSPPPTGPGSKCNTAILDEKQVLAIREMWKEKTLTQAQIGNLFGVSNFCISDIVRRKSWKHV